LAVGIGGYDLRRAKRLSFAAGSRRLRGWQGAAMCSAAVDAREAGRPGADDAASASRDSAVASLLQVRISGIHMSACRSCGV
jgi:hypothetical protein